MYLPLPIVCFKRRVTHLILKQCQMCNRFLEFPSKIQRRLVSAKIYEEIRQLLSHLWNFDYAHSKDPTNSTFGCPLIELNVLCCKEFFVDHIHIYVVPMWHKNRDQINSIRQKKMFRISYTFSKYSICARFNQQQFVRVFSPFPIATFF